MDIFDLEIKELEKKMDELLENISEDELLEELIDNGLMINVYDSKYHYIEDVSNNVWVHKKRTSKKRLFFTKKEKIDLLGAA